MLHLRVLADQPGASAAAGSSLEIEYIKKKKLCVYPLDLDPHRDLGSSESESVAGGGGHAM